MNYQSNLNKINLEQKQKTNFIKKYPSDYKNDSGNDDNNPPPPPACGGCLKVPVEPAQANTKAVQFARF